jgi:hypothetical protein
MKQFELVLNGRSHRYAPPLARLLALVGGLLFAACSDSPSPSQPEDSRLGGPASVEVTAGSHQAATVGSAVLVAPAVVVRNAQGAPVPGITVAFSVTAGGGTIEHTSVLTDALGSARPGRWVMGAAPGSNILQASVGTLTANIMATAESPFSIAVRWKGTPTMVQRDAVNRAVARWRSIILSELPDVQLRAPSGACFEGQPAIEEHVDDLLLHVEFAEIDGVNGTLGEAGPCYIRTEGSLPIFGVLRLDAADLAQAQASGTLDAIILHEVGHVLGFGTIWQEKGLITGARGSDPQFTGAHALAAFRLLSPTRLSVPVENSGSEGTRDGHWRDSVFDHELMTGYLSGNANPLSAITIGSLADLGYATNAGAADVYTTLRPSPVPGLAPYLPMDDLTERETILYPRFKAN